MHAMILAAGLGTRMRPLTAALPKPLLKVRGKALMQYHVESLARAGVRLIVVNHSRMGKKIEAEFGGGDRFGVSLRYSAEGDEPLETAGGIRRALPLLGEDPFIVVNGDIWTEYDFAALPRDPEALAHIVLVENPLHHPQGDFYLESGRVFAAGAPRYTYSGIGMFRPELFAALADGPQPLAPILLQAMQRRQVTGELYHGRWFDAGTLGRLEDLERLLSRASCG